MANSLRQPAINLWVPEDPELSNIVLTLFAVIRMAFVFILVKADLDSATFAYDCRMRFLEHALLSSCKKSHITLVIQHCL